MSTLTKYQSRCVFVAGGSGVIGKAISQHFGECQWHVGVHYHRNHESAEHTARVIHKAGGSVSLHQANVHNHTQIQTMIRLFLEQQKQLDVVIWAIGISESRLLARTTVESWSNQLITNLTGCFNLLQAVAPIFERQQHGSVIIVGSLSGIQGKTGQAAYAASKAGLIGFMKSVAKEWATWNVRVNVIFPGWHASPLAGTAYPGEADLSDHLLNGTPTAENIAKAAYHLAVMEGISGQVWNLDSRIW